LKRGYFRGLFLINKPSKKRYPAFFEWGVAMSRISDAINSYFIEMISDEVTKKEMTDRLNKDARERDEALMPATYNNLDALYVSLGCRFQDNPLKSVLLSLVFFVMLGILIANFILSFVS